MGWIGAPSAAIVAAQSRQSGIPSMAVIALYIVFVVALLSMCWVGTRKR